jgi:RecB family exonuclease
MANLFATSRPILSIEKEFEGHPKLDIRASEEDVRRYLEGQMFRLPGYVARSSELQEEIKTDIINAVDGMYVDCFEH